MKSFRALLTIVSLLVISATSLSAQAGSVVCTDGSKSAGGRGACSGHGGVRVRRKADAKADARAAKAAVTAEAAGKKSAKADEKSAKADAKSDKADAKSAKGATAECKDHTYSHAKSHRGACSAHGGVAKFLDTK